MSDSFCSFRSATYLLAGLLLFDATTTKVHGRELTQTDLASRFGIQRAWFSQVSVDSSRSHVVDWKLRNDRLYALTSAGILQALNSETGATLWTKQIGRPDGSYAGLGLNDEFIGVISGASLQLLERDTGQVRVKHLLRSAPATAPVLSKRYAFAAMSSGLIEGYSLDSPDQSPWHHQSIGRVFYEPSVSGEVVSWPTDRGYLYVSQANLPRVMYRVETGAEIVAPPTELDSFLYVTSSNGYLYCVHETSGVEIWRWSTGYPIVRKPAAVANTVYVASEEPALHALHSKTGELKWIASGVVQFVMEGEKNAYGLDRSGNLVIIEKESGGVLGRLRTGEGSTALVNDQSDRVFLVSNGGLVQCFHEADSPKPTYYRLEPVDESESETDQPEVNPFAEQPDVDGFTVPDSPGVQDNPFGPREDNPFGPADATEDAPEAVDDTDADDNPFF